MYVIFVTKYNYQKADRANADINEVRTLLITTILSLFLCDVNKKCPKHTTL